MKKKLPEINHVDLLVKSLSSKKKWIESCKINKVKIYQLIKKDKFFKNGIHEILSSRMELYKSWYPDLNEEKYLDLLVSQGAEYASMGDLYNKKLKNPIVFGLDHPKMAVFYNLNIDIPVLYGKPKYL